MTTYNIILKETKIPSYYEDAIKEYKKRLGKYCNLQITQINDSTNIENLLQGYYVIEVRAKGASIDSIGLSEKLQNLATAGHPKIAFLINIKAQNSEESIRLTSINLSDELSLVAMLEQIYRSYRILNNEPYHK